jgi:DNA processing protein
VVHPSFRIVGVFNYCLLKHPRIITPVMNNQLVYQLALTLVPQIGPVQARQLLDVLGTAETIFKSKKSLLEKIDGIGSVRAAAIRRFADFKKAEDETAFLEKYKIQTLFLTDEDYPKRLLHCYDAPVMLYYRGEAPLNSSKIVSVVGTRNKTDYGKQLTDKFIKDLSEQQVLIVSGLAMGIDTIAHKAALRNKLATVGVLAHGLDKIYPPENTLLAKEMIQSGGGILTEFRSKTKPDKHNFPSRNRIVAGLADATVVIETDIKGGSLITAELAVNYNKDVFAFPGRVGDAKSAGCNHLIKTNKAALITEAADLVFMMGWNTPLTKKKSVQKELFIQLSDEERKIVDLLKEKETTPIDEINHRSGLSSSTVAAAMLNLELQNVIVSLPGKLFKLS